MAYFYTSSTSWQIISKLSKNAAKKISTQIVFFDYETEPSASQTMLNVKSTYFQSTYTSKKEIMGDTIEYWLTVLCATVNFWIILIGTECLEKLPLSPIKILRWRPL